MSFRVQIAVFGALVVGLALLVFSLLLYGLAAGSLGTTQDRPRPRATLRTCARVAKRGCAELYVTDDGPGVPPADRERIFDRFFQADLARASSDAGLGLSVVRWIVAEHAGPIAAGHNPAGRGAAFSVSIPLTK